MNIDNIRTTINSLKASDTYNQNVFVGPYETPVGIAGQACFDAGYSRFNPVTGECSDKEGNCYDIDDIATGWFGIDVYESYDIFDRYVLVEKNRPTKEHAIAMLENFIETGEVDWNCYENFIETGRVEWERDEIEETT